MIDPFLALTGALEETIWDLRERGSKKERVNERVQERALMSALKIKEGFGRHSFGGGGGMPCRGLLMLNFLTIEIYIKKGRKFKDYTNVNA